MQASYYRLFKLSIFRTQTHFFSLNLVQPWAANKGLQLMQVSFTHSHHINNEEFYRLNRAVEKCILHVIGGRNNSQRISAEPLEQPLKTSISVSNTSNISGHGGINMDSNLRASESQLYDKMNSRRLSEVHVSHEKNKMLPPGERFSQACAMTNKARENELLDKRYFIILYIFTFN